MKLILDCNYLCYRAFFSTGGLKSNNGDSTGVLYGFLRELLQLKEKFNCEDLIFCFDYGKGIRETENPSYKSTRRQKERDMPEVEREAKQELRKQVDLLRETYLPKRLGYVNVFYQKGYEADDMIAAACKALPDGEEAVIVSADKDLYQCLRTCVSMWFPTSRAFFSAGGFVKMYGIQPKQWASVKALAGCSSDDIQGVEGVGEITAARFLAGQLKKGSEMLSRCRKGKAIHDRNYPLVKLPYKGCMKIKYAKQEIPSFKLWLSLLEELGFESLFDYVPGAPRARTLMRKK